MEESRPRALRDYALPDESGAQTSVARPTINANNFEISPALIQMIQRSQFGGNATEDPNTHLANFTDLCGTVKYNGVSDDAIKLRLFPFSLCDKAKVWLNSHPPNTFTSWSDLVKAFLNKYFPPAKTNKLRMDITGFHQQDGESLYEAWERFKDFQRRCPHHGLPEWLVIQTFYQGLSIPTKNIIDAAAGGSLMAKSTEEAQGLIEEMASNNYQWANERGNQRRSAGMYELDTINMLCAQMQNLTNMFNKQGGNGLNSCVSNAYCSSCGGNHDTCMCKNVEQVNFANNFNRPPQNNPYSSTYNPGWKNHPNFGWRDQPHNQRSSNPPGFPPKPFEPQPTWEKALEKHAQSTNERFEHMDKKIDHMHRSLEFQIGQLSNAFNGRKPGELPSKTEVNPREHVNAITLRSGRTLEDNNLGKSGEIQENKENKEKEDVDNHVDIDIPSSHIPIKNASNSIPFPDRLKKSNKEKEFEKIAQMFKQIRINIPFIDAISQIPSYAKFLKDIMSKKRKIEDYETIALAEECSARIQNKLPQKLKDPGSFTIPCTIGHLQFSNALCDLGASVSLMPLSIARRLDLREMKDTNITLQLADRSLKRPVGRIENVLIKVKDFFIPVDFIVLDMKEDVHLPIILGRPFLATAGTLIDVQEGIIKFRVNDEELVFNLHDHKDLELWHGKAFKPKEVDIVQELHNDGLFVNDMFHVKNKGKKIFIEHEIPKVNEEKRKKPSKLWDCFKCFSKIPHSICDNSNHSLFDDEDNLEKGEASCEKNGTKSFSPWEGTSSFSPPK